MQAPEYKAPAHTNSYEFTQGSGYQLPEYPFVPPPELGDTQPRRHPIVIVGGGITGLTLACSLARLGVQAILIDEDNTVGVKGASSRGICYTQKSLEIFQRLGLYDRIAASTSSATDADAQPDAPQAEPAEWDTENAPQETAPDEDSAQQE